MNAEARRAAEILKRGGLVAFPTETVYGLGADASDGAAMAHLYAVKRRPADHPVNMTGYTSAALDSLIPLAQTAVSEAEATSYWRAAARSQ